MDNVIEALESLKVPLESIKQDPRNARQHPARNLKAIMDSLDAYGQRKPIVVNAKTKTIEAGNGMWEAAQALGWDEIAVAFVKDDKAVASAYGIMDNQSALLAEWDLPTLKDLLEELDDGETNMELTGFTAEEIEDLMTQFHVPAEGLTDDDEIPEKVETVCKTGDLWQLGEHRLLCGDATKQEDVEKLMDGQKADMIFTDPPYGVNYEGGWRKTSKREKLKGDDFNAPEIYGKSIALALDNSIEKCPFYVWFSFSVGTDIFNVLHKILRLKTIVIWRKVNTGYGNINHHYKQVYEPCFYGARPSTAENWFGANNEISVWEEKKDFFNEFHPTQKPIVLPARAMKNSSKQDDIILDLFGGSGSTLIACEQTHRKCYMMEIDPHYCDVIVKRWEDFTGKKARHG